MHEYAGLGACNENKISTKFSLSQYTIKIYTATLFQLRINIGCIILMCIKYVPIDLSTTVLLLIL